MGKTKAVAVRYDKGIDVPLVMAKGEGAVADKIISEAKLKNVPITENTTLVDMIGMAEVGNEVPEEAWSALAAVFAFILEHK